MNQDRIEKVEKLLRKAERAGTQEEAETFFAKAQDLMAKWAIDEAMLDIERGEKREEIETSEIFVNKSGFWKSNCRLIHLISKASGVQAIRMDGFKVTKRQREIVQEQQGEEVAKTYGKPKMIMVGFPSDLKRVEMLYASMRLQITRMSNKEIPEDIKGSTSEAFLWRRSFLDAFGERIYQRLEEVRKMAQSEKEEEYGTDNLLPVLASKEVQVKNKYEEMFPDARKLRTRAQKVDWHGRERGRAAADRADIGSKPVAGSAKGELG